MTTKPSARRKFYDFGDSSPTQIAEDQSADRRALLEYVRNSVIGRKTKFQSPFGPREITYADYTASGRALLFIEQYVQEQVLPYYANTHTTTSVASLQMTMFRHEARDIIRGATNCSEYDAVIFTGSGATGAVHKLIHGLNLSGKTVVVFVGPYEHHSNLLPWRELPNVSMVKVPATSSGQVDIEALDRLLAQYDSSVTKIGAFSAASNVTGILVDTNAISICLHARGALAVFDYAAAGPYVPIDMNPVIVGPDHHLCYKDAIFLSPHKFIGGVSTPGILLVKKKLFTNATPSGCGGGTVFFVSEDDHRYLQDIETREEGGTPDIVGAIRAGLVFQLKRAIGPHFIQTQEVSHAQKILNRLRSHSSLEILGLDSEAPPQVDRLCIISFLVRSPCGFFLHHNFVCTILNDLFGVQSRGGCACAGPYAQKLLGITSEQASAYESILIEDDRLDRTHLRRREEHSDVEVIRPGFSRISINYFETEEEIDFICKSVEWVATHGWKLLPLYILNPETGEWKHRQNQLLNDRIWLGSIRYNKSGMSFEQSKAAASAPPPENEYFRLADEVVDQSLAALSKRHTTTVQPFSMSQRAELMRWFIYPHEAETLIRENGRIQSRIPPFAPLNWTQSPLAHSAVASVTEVVTTTIVQTEEFDHEFGASEVDHVVPPSPMRQQVAVRFHIPPKRGIMKPFFKAVEEFDMIRPGDRVLVCLSGGKDSLSLLHALKHYQFAANARGAGFTLGAATVDPQNPLYDPSPLKAYLAELGVPYFYLSEGITDRAAAIVDLSSICSFCSRVKRGLLYACARREGYNVLALGHHLDDLAETFMMDAFHNGLLFTMRAHYRVKEKDLRVIRPFAFVREHDLRAFADMVKLPVISENCPACFEAPTERYRVKQLLASQELAHPRLFQNLQKAMMPLIAVGEAQTRLCDQMVAKEKEDEEDFVKCSI